MPDHGPARLSERLAPLVVQMAIAVPEAILILNPGLAITIIVGVGMNFFADGVQDALDPRHIHGQR